MFEITLLRSASFEGMMMLCFNSSAQSYVTYNHDATKMNQITVQEIGAGGLTPAFYYDALHNSYQKSAAKKNKQSAKPLKEVQLSVNITEHDLQTKANNARKFIENGNKVKVTLTMKGRELSRRDESKRSILEFIVMLEDIAVPESQPRDDGNKTIVILKKKG